MALLWVNSVTAEACLPSKHPIVVFAVFLAKNKDVSLSLFCISDLSPSFVISLIGSHSRVSHFPLLLDWSLNLEPPIC